MSLKMKNLRDKIKFREMKMKFFKKMSKNHLPMEDESSSDTDLNE